ncbi:MAG: hypothetical protein QNJ97_08095 [Myxococcota bacterium]|nr:hypothetical protein [Myxococcota bacterium]
MKTHVFKILFFGGVALFATACVDPPDPPRPRVPPRRTPIPERVASTTAMPKQDPSSTVKAEIDEAHLVKGRTATRFATPGLVRWTRKLPQKIGFIRSTPLAGLIVSAGPVVHNATSLGEIRWPFVAGAGHRLFVLGASEVIWSPAFGRLSQLLRRGRKGWVRKWQGKLARDERGGLYLLDASTVTAINEDGTDKWRAALEGVRKLEGPFTCEDSVLFQGTSGLQRVAVRISAHGTAIRKTPLGRGAILIGAGPQCAPLVWVKRSIALLDTAGDPIWHRRSPETPFVERLQGGFALVRARAELPARLEVITDHGGVIIATELPVSGRLTHTDVLSVAGMTPQAIGLCSDVTSPCSKPGTTRGPFNAFVTLTERNGFRPLVRHVQGHLNVAPYPAGGYILASAATGDTTDLSYRSQDASVIWQVTLPGRLSAGPHIGPAGEVYLGTCRGWDCEEPHLLISVTGMKPPPDPDD